MKRDMDMIRDIMLQLRDASGPISGEQLLPNHEDRALVHYHTWLIIDAGLAEGTVADCMGGSCFVSVRRLTWQGQDFLAAASDRTTWEEAVRRIKATTGEVTFQVLVKVLSEVALNTIGVHR